MKKPLRLFGLPPTRIFGTEITVFGRDSDCEPLKSDVDDRGQVYLKIPRELRRGGLHLNVHANVFVFKQVPLPEDPLGYFYVAELEHDVTRYGQSPWPPNKTQQWTQLAQEQMKFSYRHTRIHNPIAYAIYVVLFLAPFAYSAIEGSMPGVLITLLLTVLAMMAEPYALGDEPGI